MAFYSEDIIEEIRSRADIVDIISERVHLQKKKAAHILACALFIMKKVLLFL